MPRYAHIIVDIVHENVAHDFTYRVPAGMRIQPGQRVEVPFGRLRKEGIVLSLSDETEVPPDKLRDVLQTLEDYPAVLPQMIALAQWMAQESHCPLAETLRLMIPSEMRGGRVHEKTRPMVQLAIPQDQLADAIDRQGRSKKRRLILQLISDGKPHAVGDLKLMVSDPLPDIKKLAQAGIVTFFQQEVLRAPGEAVPPSPDWPLTASQTEVLEEMLPCVRNGTGRFLLHGVTGSGKTEVFIRLVRETLANGKSAMILVPEIALTPQMVNWFRSRFGEVAAVIHSGLSAGERFDEWRRIRRGDARVVIGARSAVFAPCDQLGLIVVDEEHETTYLSDRHPRYDARRVAARRCEQEGATLVLASATPSILSFAMARRGDYRLVEMPERVHHRPLPETTIVDMRQELELGNRSVLSLQLQQALRHCVAEHQQAMLLMNRRGYNAFVSCRKCGAAVKCPNCDVSLTYHVGSSDQTLRCHYCGHRQDPPSTCPECGSSYIRYFGAGTQKVQEEVEKLLPGVKTVRMDVDTTAGKDGHRKLLDEFRSGRAQVMIGTQMIAKGLDFPDVTLVGVIAADMTLNLPDYRSRERTFQLLTQVAGRAGRGEKPGHVYIQSYKPEDPVILQSAAQDYRSFFESQFARRRRSLYPPFTMMARFLVESVSDEQACRRAGELNERMEKLLEEHPKWRKRVLLCMLDQPGIRVLRGKSRYHVLMKLLVHPETDDILAAISDWAREEVPGTETYLEVDPTTMM